MESVTTIDDWTRRIERDIAAHPVYIFAKGEKNAAMCGFSHRVMQIFDQMQVPFEVQNIFADPNVRPAVCAFTNWPTIPQVFIGGKFVGGCDIVTEMAQNGELKQALEAAGVRLQDS